MPLDPQVKEVLDQIAALGLPPHYEVGAVQARENAKLRPRVAGPDVAAVEDRHRARPRRRRARAHLLARRRRPVPHARLHPRRRHGRGHIETCDAACRRICLGAGCVVISPGYRLAPEHPFPAAPEDCFAVVSWTADNAESLRGDASRLAVGGESAGGNLAAAVALMARDRGGPSLVHQSIINPMLGLDFDTESYLRNAEGYFLTRKTMMWYWEQS